MSPEFLVTHSGGFHADELLSSVILTRLFPQARIVRSRAPEWITPAPDRIIYDVGGNYDAAAQIFDHHQRGAPLREDGQPYSSFGLIWNHYGRDYLAASDVPAAHIETVYAAFDASFVVPIDLTDNGALSPTGPLAGLTLPTLLETLKPAFDDTDPEADDRAFHAALAIARSFVEAAIWPRRSAATMPIMPVSRRAISATSPRRSFMPSWVISVSFGSIHNRLVSMAGSAAPMRSAPAICSPAPTRLWLLLRRTPSSI